MTDQEICKELKRAVEDMDRGLKRMPMMAPLEELSSAGVDERRGRAILRAVQTDLDILRHRIENENN